jgi:hypothetical protein
MFRSVRASTLLTLTVLALAACGDETELPTDLATAEATEDVELTSAAFETPATMSLVDLGVSIDDALILAGGGATLSSVVAAGPMAAAPSRDVLERVEQAAASPDAALPASVLGKTFEWDIVDDRYEQTDRTGAPANGVTFILYTIDTLTLEPAEPLVEIGSVTIEQGGTDANPSATLTVRNLGGQSVFSYTATRGGTAAIPSYSISGSAGLGPNAATFSLTVGVNLISQNVTAVWRTEIPARSLTTRTTLGVNPNTGAVTLTGVMQRGLRRVEISGGFNSALGGQLTVKVGNRTFARIVMDGESGVTITNPDGEPLTPEEEETLELIFRWFESSLTWYSALLDPVYTALGVE